MHNRGGAVSLINSAVFGNDASYGGGIANGSSTLTISDSTISGNSASGTGGGVANFASLRSDVVLNRSLISGNSATLGAEVYQLNGGVVATGPSNLFGHSGLTNAAAFVNFVPGGTDVVATSDGNTPSALIQSSTHPGQQWRPDPNACPASSQPGPRRGD
jgi:hypothetical protein